MTSTMSVPQGHPRSIPLPRASLMRLAGAPAQPALVHASLSPSGDRRRFHRIVLVNGPVLRMEVRRPDGTRLFGIVEDCCWTGAGVRFGYSADPNIRVDQGGRVVLTSNRLPDITLRARVASAEPLQSGGTRYGVQFVDEDEVRSQVTPEWRRFFSTRRAPRFIPRGELAATITLTWRGGEARGRVVDVSMGGLAVLLDVEAARAVVIAREVGVLLAYPGSGGTMRLRAKVRGAKQGTPSVRVGLEFARDAMLESCLQRLEDWTGRLSAKFGQTQ
jgi:hypothetical protein